MANVTDLTGSQNTTDKDTSTKLPKDSNINVFEFGNLILADIFPALIALVNYIADLQGSSVNASDKSGRTMWITPGPIIASEDEEEMTDEVGVRLVMEGPDMLGVYAAIAVVDISGT